MSIYAHTDAGDMMLLNVSGLRVIRGQSLILENVSFSLGRGEVMGLVGRNGSGKTTILDALCGLVPCDGSIILKGQEIQKKNSIRRARLGIARTFQESAFTRELTVWENCLQGVDHRIRGIDRSNSGEDSALLLGWGQHFDHRLDDFAGWLSNANRRRIEFVRAVVRKPRLLLLDEPTAGMNDYEAKEFVNWLCNWRSHCRDVGVILCEHRVWVIEMLERSARICSVRDGGLIQV